MATMLSLFWTLLLFFFTFSQEQEQQPFLDPTEQEAVYNVLHSINPEIPWRTIFPDDLCLSAPHGVVCDYYPSNSSNTTTPHVIELSFGCVSDDTPNPPCSPNATLNPLLFTSFHYLRKLFFYKCFNNTTPIVPTTITSLPSTLEELVFINNPSFLFPLNIFLANNNNNSLISLRRLILIQNGFHGQLPPQFGAFLNLEELSLSGNQLSGEVPASLGLLKKLKVLDLSNNNFQGCVPEQLGNLTSLLKLDLSHNNFRSKIPETLRKLQSLEFLDLSFNFFGNFGVPLFLGEVPTLKEVYLSGNLLSGEIPEIWENLGGIVKIGFSKMGLVGNIPSSMGVYLKNLSYLGLDNNRLDGPVPEEFGLLEFADEINLENNNLSGRVPFAGRFGQKKIRLAGNRGLCLENSNNYSCGDAGNGGLLGQLKPCKIKDVPDATAAAVLFNGVPLVGFDPLTLFLGWLWLFLFSGLEEEVLSF